MQITLNEKESAEYINNIKRTKEIYTKYNELVSLLEKQVVMSDIVGLGSNVPESIYVRGKAFEEICKYLKPFYYEDLEVLKEYERKL